ASGRQVGFQDDFGERAHRRVRDAVEGDLSVRLADSERAENGVVSEHFGERVAETRRLARRFLSASSRGLRFDEGDGARVELLAARPYARKVHGHATRERAVRRLEESQRRVEK